MAKHLRTGEWGEQLAARFLEDKGLRILERNWRFSRAEIDLIAEEGEVLVFVEVKTRTSDYFGPPERFVSARKRQLLADAALAADGPTIDKAAVAKRMQRSAPW